MEHMGSRELMVRINENYGKMSKGQKKLAGVSVRKL